jgi:hypothetical protein
MKKIRVVKKHEDFDLEVGDVFEVVERGRFDEEFVPVTWYSCDGYFPVDWFIDNGFAEWVEEE